MASSAAGNADADVDVTEPVTAVLLCNSHASINLAAELGDEWGPQVGFPATDEPVHHMRTPKALLPLADGSGRCLLDDWWDTCRTMALPHNIPQIGVVARTYLVCSATFFKHYERWATSRAFPVGDIINDGTTNAAFPHRRPPVLESGESDTTLIPAKALAVLARRTGCTGRVLVLAAESAPSDAALEGIVSFAAQPSSAGGEPSGPYHASGGRWLMAQARDPYHAPNTPAILLSAGALRTLSDDPDGRTKMCKGLHSLSEVVTIVLGDILTKPLLLGDDAVVKLLPWEDNDEALLVAYRAYLRPGGYGGDIDVPWPGGPMPEPAVAPLVKRACCRVGVMGNPSDGFFGKTISLSVANFWAEVRLWPSRRLRILPHPLYDPTEFGSLADLHAVVSHEGTEGGVRLLLAACKRFYQFAKEHAIELRTDSSCTLAYDTNVPRQVGLAGSSAILTATVQALLAFHGVTPQQLPVEQLPSLVLSIEKEELGINAGLQDRVIQAYGGLVYMDFAREHLEATGRGVYERLPMELAPPLWLAYLADPSDSGKMHNDVRKRYDAGDAQVVGGMQRFAAMTAEARQAILDGDHQRLGELMASNFSLRRELYGDGPLGAANLRMVEIASSHGVPAKFPGSGGAVVGLCVPDAAAMAALQHDLERNGCVFVRIEPAQPLA